MFEGMKCSTCKKEKPEEVFNGKKQCSDCRASASARRIAPPTLPGHLRCTKCANEKPEEVFDGKKLCPDCLASMTARRIAPPTLPGHLRCTKCANERPEEVFDGKKKCPDCLASNAARKNAPPTLPGHQRCTLCAKEKPEEVFDGKKLCPECLADGNAYHKRMANDPYYVAARKARTANRRAAGDLTGADILHIRELFNARCIYCDRTTTHTKGKWRYQMDHIIPVTRGGLSLFYNTANSCRPCNNSKLASDPFEWWTAQPFYSEERATFLRAHMACGIEHTDRTEFLSV
jgi:hypothetical protein